MSRTTRQKKRRPWSKEIKEQRKQWTRKLRARTRQAIHRGEDGPRWRKTCGWMTW